MPLLAPLQRLLRSDVRGRVAGLYAGLIAFNVLAWSYALVAFHDRPVLLGTALLAYSFGLRDAVDADHIAAIDTVTRKLLQDGKRVVVAVMQIQHRFLRFNEVAGTFGTLVSGLFLLTMAAMNAAIALSVYRTFRHVRAGGAYDAERFDILLNNRGLIARLVRPWFGLVRQSSQMLLIGPLFGTGFDIATEVSLLTVAAT
ncbi:hypothetical protein [Lichenicoccus sp.]|uniref:HoxN/HupN/NixA family nickel/cobalt transporter n=1 Tax=Lichenicoccus sp. TaxID=2781899 RepID=UPI003D14177D